MSSRLLGLGLALVSILALVLWGAQVAEWRSYVACQTQVNDNLVRVLQHRSDNLEKERAPEAKTDAALLAAMNVLLDQPPPPLRAESLKALADLRTALQEQAEQRAANDREREKDPLPELPSGLCD